MIRRDRQRSLAIDGNCRMWTDLSEYRSDARRARLRLRLVRNPQPSPRGLRLYAAVRNEIDLLPMFLAHYRRLGVDRFIVVDNDSTDGSAELLLDQPDVELHHTTASYAAANGGTLWIDGLMQEQAADCWVVYVDADELLVYDGCDKHPLPVVAERLEARGQRNLLAPLVDLYCHPHRPEEWLFDAAPELAQETRRGLIVAGGPRYRMAAATGWPNFPCLTKYPFARYGASTAFANIHLPYPGDANGYRVGGRLLHLKLTSRFRNKVEAALREGQRWKRGIEYRGYAQWLAAHDIADLITEKSRRYDSPADLIRANLLEPIDWRRGRPGILASLSGMVGQSSARLRWG